MKDDFCRDMTIPCCDGIVNIRVGAIIIKDGKILMVGNDGTDYLYSVGGRIKFGETAEEAVVREVKEETGVTLQVDRLGFIHENYFIGDSPAKEEKTVYEISFFFYMKTPSNFRPNCDSFTEDARKERLVWIKPNAESKIYPDFFKTEDLSAHASTGIKHFVTDGRRK